VTVAQETSSYKIIFVPLIKITPADAAMISRTAASRTVIRKLLFLIIHLSSIRNKASKRVRLFWRQIFHSVAACFYHFNLSVVTVGGQETTL